MRAGTPRRSERQRLSIDRRRRYRALRDVVVGESRELRFGKRSDSRQRCDRSLDRTVVPDIQTLPEEVEADEELLCLHALSEARSNGCILASPRRGMVAVTAIATEPSKFERPAAAEH